MPFEKGRQKTGGKVKGDVNEKRKSSRFLERLKGYGFNYDAEMAQVLKDLRDLRTADRSSGDAIRRIEELKFFYSELKSLLPYMTPKLKEKEVATVDLPETPSNESISTDDILKALGNGSDQTQTQPRTSDPHPVGTGSAELSVPASTEEDLSNLVGEQEEDE